LICKPSVWAAIVDRLSFKRVHLCSHCGDCSMRLSPLDVSRAKRQLPEIHYRLLRPLRLNAAPAAAGTGGSAPLKALTGSS
jgi:hypothetical protein